MNFHADLRGVHATDLGWKMNIDGRRNSEVVGLSPARTGGQGRYGATLLEQTFFFTRWQLGAEREH